MNILFFTRGVPTDTFPLNGLFEFDQAKALVKLGHKVVYIAVDLRSIRRKRKFGFSQRTHEDVEIVEYNFPVGNVPPHFRTFIGKIIANKLYNYVLKYIFTPDLVHAHFTEIAFMAAHMVNGDIPLIITEHSSNINAEKIAKDTYNMAKFAYNKANAVIAVSNKLASAILKNFGIHCEVVSNMYDNKCFSYSNNKPKDGIYRFISIGSLRTIKRMDLLVQAFSQEFKGENVILEIYGNGTERMNLEKLIIKFGVKEQVFLKGQQLRETLSIALERSDCFVLVSNSETFGVVYIEAMAKGLPLIGTLNGGAEDIINEKCGILVPCSDVEKLKSAMRNMHDKIYQYNFNEISNMAEETYSPDAISKKILNIYYKSIKHEAVKT